MISVAIKARHIKALIPIAAKNDPRSYLTGIYVEVGQSESRIVACDWHCLGVIRSDFGHDNEDVSEPVAVIIPIYVAQILAKGKTEIQLHIGDKKDLGLERDCQAVTEDGATIGFASLDGEYPQWRRAAELGKTDDTSPAQFQSNLISKFAKTAKVLGDAKGDFVIWHRGQDEAAGVYMTFEPDFFGVIMPMRQDKKSGTPDWAISKLYN